MQKTAQKTPENNFEIGIGIEWQVLKNGAGVVIYSSFCRKNPKLNSSYIMGR